MNKLKLLTKLLPDDVLHHILQYDGYFVHPCSDELKDDFKAKHGIKKVRSFLQDHFFDTLEMSIIEHDFSIIRNIFQFMRSEIRQDYTYLNFDSSLFKIELESYHPLHYWLYYYSITPQCNQKIVCKCGITMQFRNFKRHLHTKKHIILCANL